jgi:ATP-binding cassette subfamily B protein
MREIYQFARPYFHRYRKGMMLGFGALILRDVLGVCQPLVIRAGVDSLTEGFRLALVLQMAAALVLLTLLKGFFMYWMRVILVGISRDIEFDVRNRIFGHLVSMPPDFYQKYRTGDLIARSTNDLNAVRMMLGPGVMYWFETVLTLVLAMGVMLWVDWRLTLVAMAPAPLISVLVVVFGQRIHARFEKIQEMFSDISSRVQENLAGVRVVRAYVQEEAEIGEFERLNQSYVKQNLSLARMQGLFLPMLQALVGIGFALVLWIGGRRVLDGSLTIGGFVMFNTYLGMLVWPMIAMGWVINLMQRGRASLGRIQELLRQFPSICAPPDAAPLPAPLRGEIEFRNVMVDFGDRVALDRVNLKIEAGSTVAIVGHTGGGKTTLVNLVPRLLDPTGGAVLLDGIDVRRFDPEELRLVIGFVPQETFLFSCTLGENVAFGVKSASEEEIRRAAEIAGLAADVAGFPNGFGTMVGERGITLSGGQKQRTAIARAVLRDPRILILDDALSSVDTVTEERILEGLSDVMRGRTTILISHRVSTIRGADRIVVIENGRIAEEGSHAELLQRGGYYADLYQRQLLEEELETI